MWFIAVLLVYAQGAYSLDLDLFNEYFNGTYSSSSECQSQKEVFVKSLQSRSQWALSMLDSYGRIPQAVTQGNTYALGMYDQCLDLFEEVDNVTVKGKYCLGGLALPFTLEENNTMTLLISVCIPDACLPSDFFSEYGKDDDCQTKNENKTLDAGDIAFVAFSLFVLSAVIASTAYDMHLQKRSKAARHKILVAFSAYTNGKKIIKVSHQPGQILFFNGLKVISLFWVVLGHRWESTEAAAVNKADVEKWKISLPSMYTLLFALSVDTFYFISAVLLTYSFLKTHRKPDKKFNFLLYCAHRYFRLTPAMAALYFFQVTVARRMVSGPYIPQHDLLGSLGTSCIENWWSYFLYVQNYVSPDNMCLTHTWYVDVDMQLIFFSPLVLLPLLRWPKRMKHFFLPLLIFITTIHPMLITYFYDIARNSRDFMSRYYLLSHMRVSGWLTGILFGAFMLDFREKEAKYRISNKIVHTVGWAMVFAVFAVQYPLERDFRRDPGSVLRTALYYPLQRTIWPLCLCWISYECLCGNGGFVNWFLSLPVFQVLSKVIYSTYLIHVSLIAMQVKHSRTLPYFGDYELIRAAIADIAVALVAGTIWALAFEYPGINIEQVIFGEKAPKKSGKEQDRRGAS